MATKNRVTLRSNFPAVKKAMWGAVQAARDHALDEGEAEAEKRLDKINDSHGYNLATEVKQENLGHQSGRIFYDHLGGSWGAWRGDQTGGVPYGRFFEYGTVHLPATPFMRPAHRKMRKTFLDDMGDEAPKWIRRKAGMGKFERGGKL